MLGESCCGGEDEGDASLYPNAAKAAMYERGSLSNNNYIYYQSLFGLSLFLGPLFRNELFFWGDPLISLECSLGQVSPMK